MSFVELQWVLITIGLIYLITESAILGWFRVWLGRDMPLLVALLYCRACTGFWVGVANAYWLWPEAFTWQVPIKGGLAAMAIGALWSAWHPNTAFANERRYFREAAEEDEDDDGERPSK